MFQGTVTCVKEDRHVWERGTIKGAGTVDGLTVDNTTGIQLCI